MRTTVRWKFGIDEARPGDEEMSSSDSNASISSTRLDGVSRDPPRCAPAGLSGRELFEIVETPISDPAQGQVLIRNAFLSVDPYMRPRMNDRRSYVVPYTLGEPMTVARSAGSIACAEPDSYAEGDWVVHGSAGASGRSRTAWRAPGRP